MTFGTLACCLIEKKKERERREEEEVYLWEFLKADIHFKFKILETAHKLMDQVNEPFGY